MKLIDKLCLVLLRWLLRRAGASHTTLSITRDPSNRVPPILGISVSHDGWSVTPEYTRQIGDAIKQIVPEGTLYIVYPEGIELEYLNEALNNLKDDVR